MATPPPQSATSHYAASAAMAARGVEQARVAAPGGGLVAVATTVATYQAAQAVMAQNAVAQMLAEQAIEEAADALLNAVAFTTSIEVFTAMAESAGGLESPDFDRLVASIIQDAGRAAESVSVAARPNIAHVRFVNPPCCARCAVLAGRIYRWSDGFLRHPGCDCSMIPTTVTNDEYVQDPVELMEQGLVRGLSQADQQAIRDGADFNRVVNIRKAAAGLRESGAVLSRRGRLTPEAIYRQTRTRDEALSLLDANGFLL